MYRLFLLFFAITSVLANPLQLNLPQQLANSISTNTSATHATNLGKALVHCFNRRPHDEPIAKHDCEEALDSFVGTKDLTLKHTFAKSGRRTDTFPMEQTFDTCSLNFDLVNDNDRVSITLGEIYAEVLAPAGVIKMCLGTDPDPDPRAVGGRTYLGKEGMLIVTLENPRSPRLSSIEKRA